jgi:hypothetical protein
MMFNQRLLGLRSPQITHVDLITGGAIVDGSVMDEYDIDLDDEDDRGRVPEATARPDPVYEELTYDGVDEDALLQQALNMTQPSTSHREDETPFGIINRNIGSYSSYNPRLDVIEPGNLNVRFDSLTSQNIPIERGMIGLPIRYPDVVNRVIKKSQEDVKKELQRERISRYTSGPSTSYDIQPIDIQSRLDELENIENSSRFTDEDRRELNYLREVNKMDADIFFKQSKMKPKTVAERSKIVEDKLREDLDAPIDPILGPNTVQTTYIQLVGSEVRGGIKFPISASMKKKLKDAAITTEMERRTYELEMASRSYQDKQDKRTLNPFIEREIAEPTEYDIELRKRLSTMTPEQIEQMSFRGTEFDLKNISIDNYLDSELANIEDTRRLAISGNMVNPYNNMTDYEILQLYENMDELKKNSFKLKSPARFGRGRTAKPITIDGMDLTNDDIIVIGGILENIPTNRNERDEYQQDFFDRYKGNTSNIIKRRTTLLDGKISDAHLRYIEERAKTLMGIPTYGRKARLDIPITLDEGDDEDLEVQEQYESIRDFLPDDVDLEAMDLEEIDDPLDALDSYADEMYEVIESAVDMSVDKLNDAIENLKSAIRTIKDNYANYTYEVADRVREHEDIANNEMEQVSDIIRDYDIQNDYRIEERIEMYRQLELAYLRMIQMLPDLIEEEEEEEEEEEKEEDPDNLIESKEDDESVKRKRERPIEVIDLVSTDEEEEEEEEEPEPKKQKRGPKIINYNNTILKTAIEFGTNNLNEIYDDVWENETVFKKQGRRIDQNKLEEIDAMDDNQKKFLYANRLRTLRNPKISNFNEVSENKTKQQIIDEYKDGMIEDGYLSEEDRNKKLDGKGVYIAHLYQYFKENDTPPPLPPSAPAPPPSAPTPPRKKGRPPKKKDNDKEGSGMKSKFKVIKL